MEGTDAEDLSNDRFYYVFPISIPSMLTIFV